MEQPPSPERLIQKEEVLEALRSGSPEAYELAVRWTEQRERETEAAGPRERVLFNAERHELYLATGDFNGAVEALRDAQDEAYQEHLDDLVEELEGVIDALLARREA